MNLAEKILKLTTTALGLKGKVLRLQGEEFVVGIAAVTNDNGPREDLAALTLQLFFEEDGPKKDKDCNCQTCKITNAMTDKVALMTSALLVFGKTDRLILDSCGACDNGFTAKVRNTATRRCDVGEGTSMVLAVADATAKASRE